MEKRDLLIIKYLSEGYKITEIREQLITYHSITISKSLIEKRLNTISKQYQAKTLFQLAVFLTKEKII
ncbi:hypothetical protein [Chryseobacterium artocarpi]|uniref:hypothetical protein n=1 Tax=Chryseobacterium artocarpi TaxID=1414727 RepID=UPI003F37D333